LAPAPVEAAPAPTPAPDLPAGHTITRYRQVIGRYAPKPLDVRLVILRPETNRDLRPTLGWSAISARADAHVMRGDHHSALTQHVGATAAMLRACLEGTPA
jgi:hypothetical protein